MSDTVTGWREASGVVPGQPMSDGAGVRLSRSLGSPRLSVLDPFLLLDEFRSDNPDDYLAGFPDHPHRGFETVTYMLAGSMEHRDSTGNRGELGPGSVQWMTAGRGIIHSEMPRQHEGLMWGFQLWVNLPGRDKMTDPRYQDIDGAEVPEVEIEGGSVRVIAGSSHGATGPVSGIAVSPLYIDVRLGGATTFDQDVTEGHNGFVYVYEGEASVGVTDDSSGTTVGRGNLAVLGKSGRLRVRVGDGGARFLVVAARPIGEPVARYGPFVMNTVEELEQAFRDYKSGRLTD